MPNAKLITAIIPVRLSVDKLYDEVERIERIASTLPEQYDILIVDYGTGIERAEELVAVSRRISCRLVRVDTGHQPFSVGHARDIGAQNATTPLVIFHDIDFIMSTEGYRKVILECRLRNMPNAAYSFFALPGAYLTENFSKQYLRLLEQGDGEFGDRLLHDGIMRSDKKVFENFTYAISAIVVNRYHLLAIGGHDKSFTGHGAEDFELMHRLTSYHPRGPRTRDYYKNTRDNSISRYEGFRAFYALYGIDVFQRGLVLAHLSHPRRDTLGYTGTGNQARVAEIMRSFDQGETSIPPLNDYTSKEKTLVLVRPGSSPHKALRHVLPALGRFSLLPEQSFVSAEALLEFLEEDGFSQVLFLNPYGNDRRLSFYLAAKSAGIRVIVFDRGALNNSWFFDRNGFLGESRSYLPARWNKPISDEEREETQAWITGCRIADETLELNGSRVGSDHLRHLLGIGDRKVIFVALQRPSDTATVYFSGPCGSAQQFNEWVQFVANGIDQRKYVVIVKKHPLETVRPLISNVTFVDDSTHINDLIDLAEKVVVINSGVGLIAMSYGKPVICCGNAFYAHDGLAAQASSPETLIDLCGQQLQVDEESRLRFMKYLIFDFYSFGKSEYLDKIEEDGSKRRIVKKTIYSVLRGLTDQPILLGSIQPGISLDAPLFYSFGGRTGIKGQVPQLMNSKPRPPATLAPPKTPLATKTVKISETTGSSSTIPSVNPDALHEEGLRRFHDKAYLEAARLLEEAARRKADHVSPYRSASEAYLSAGNREKAIEMISHALSLKPGSDSIARRKSQMEATGFKRLFMKQTPYAVPKAPPAKKQQAAQLTLASS